MDRRRGQGLILDPLSPLARAEYLAVGEAQGQAKGARITGAIALTEAEVLQHLRHRIERKPTLRWVADERRVEALLEQRLGAITFARGSDPSPDPKAIAAFLCARIRADGLDLLPLGKASQSLLRRARYAGIEALSDESLLADLEDWAAPHLVRRLENANLGALHQALLDRLGWDGKQALDKLAPQEFRSPAGTTHAIDYDDPGGPSVEIACRRCSGWIAIPASVSPASPCC
jgi:ATP-dependent helicase HrpB